jgi:hypothetical protein
MRLAEKLVDESLPEKENFTVKITVPPTKCFEKSTQTDYYLLLASLYDKSTKTLYFGLKSRSKAELNFLYLRLGTTQST